MEKALEIKMAESGLLNALRLAVSKNRSLKEGRPEKIVSFVRKIARRARTNGINPKCFSNISLRLGTRGTDLKIWANVDAGLAFVVADGDLRALILLPALQNPQCISGQLFPLLKKGISWDLLHSPN